MKTMQATDAKNRFGELLEDVVSEPVIIQKDGRDVAVLISKAEFDQHYRKQSNKELIQRSRGVHRALWCALPSPSQVKWID